MPVAEATHSVQNEDKTSCINMPGDTNNNANLSVNNNNNSVKLGVDPRLKNKEEKVEVAQEDGWSCAFCNQIDYFLKYLFI